MTYLLLFYEFFKTGLLAVGGGLATLPFLLKMMEKYPAWFNGFTLADIVGVAESTPGPVGVNAATFAGYSAGGVLGALVATLGLTLPSYIVIALIAKALTRYRNSKLVNDAFSGLRPAVTGLIAAAGYAVLKLALVRGDPANGFFAAVDWRCAALFAVVFTLTQLPRVKKLHPILFILLGAAAGLLLGL